VPRLRLTGRSRLRLGRRLAALASALAVGGVALSACAPAHEGAAATVGNVRISVDQVKAGAATALADAGTQASASADVASLQRKVLSRFIEDDLLAAAARAKSVTVSEGEVQTALANAEQANGGKQQLESLAAQQGIAAADLHDYLYYALLEQKVGGALTANTTVPTADLKLIVAADKSSADQALAQVGNDPSKFAAAAQQFSQDTTSSANGGDIGSLPLATLPEPLKTDVTTKAVGAIFEELIQGQYYVVLISSRADTPFSQLDSQTAQSVQTDAVDTYLASISKQQPISVSPRFGSWDPAQAAVVASTGALVSPAQGSAAASPLPSDAAGG
jgi:parvulin-like peptidyl-prolyl isomerase